MISLGLLISGDLGYVVLKHFTESHPVIFIMTDKNSTEIINFCEQEKIKCFIGNPRSGRCSNFIQNKNISVLISANYPFLIDKELISLPQKIAFNIHGSLLPKYRGRAPHVWAIINNESETGITAHIIDEGCDTGDIIEQIILPIKEEDTGADVLNKFKNNYINLIRLVLEKIKNNEITLKKQAQNNASFFGKRTPESGHIQWSWQKERIRNWVRAQADPYPGAFTFYGGKKIIIDKISYTDDTYTYDMQNGLIISVNPIIVKTPNGAIELDVIRDNSIQVEINQILN